MNRFEQAVNDCMQPTAALLEETTKPMHRAILLNFWRHVHLEGAGQFEKIIASDMMVEHPVYRVTWGANPAVIEGTDGILDAITPAKVRAIHEGNLAKLEAELGEGFWLIENC